MNVTKLRISGKVINNDTMTNPKNGVVEGFYYQDLDDGKVKHYIYNCPMTWEVDPASLSISKAQGLPFLKETETVTKIDDIKELQERLVQCCIDFIKERNLTDVFGVSFGVDGLTDSIEFGEWVPSMDSSITVEGLKMDKDGYNTRAIIGEYM